MTSAPDIAVRSDAFTGTETATGTFASNYRAWAVSPSALPIGQWMAPDPARPEDWADERVGWGIVLPEREGLSPAALATADDAPEPIHALVAQRAGAVLRYRAGTQYGDWTLRDYRPGGGDLFTAASPPGSQARTLPMYLLIYGTPAEIPWHVQYRLNPVRYVGRLDLTGDGLANYVSALMTGWPAQRARYDAPVIWAVDHGGGDITTLMRRTIADPVEQKLAADKDMAAIRYINGATTAATGQALAAALEANTPALVVTTSHGLTSPIGDPVAIAAGLGLPVDATGSPVDPADLLARWQPDGAIWFAQACCSVGADRPSTYRDLFARDTPIARVLAGVAEAGPITAPLPRALLGARKPIRAFVGRVEPTFNWTLSFPPNQQSLTADLQNALYDRLCLGLPVGLAFAEFYRPIGSLLLSHGQAVSAYNTTAGKAATEALDLALYLKVTAQDRANTVILGDPTVAIAMP